MIKTIIDQATKRDRNSRRAVEPSPASSKESLVFPLWIETTSIVKTDHATLQKLQLFRPLEKLKRQRVANERENASWGELKNNSNRLRSNNFSGDRACPLFEEKYEQKMPCLNARTAANAILVGRNILQISSFATQKRSNSDDHLA